MSSKSIPLKIKILLFLFVVGCLNAQITSFPYVEDFESGTGGWTVNGTNTSWELGNPQNSIINYAPSGTNAWVTNLSGDYLFNEDGWVQSPVFDFSSMTNPRISLFVFWNCEYYYDGAVIQSSIDSGITWQNIGVYGTDPNWFTYNNIYSNPGGQGAGWTGTIDDSWGSYYYYGLNRDLTGLEGQSNVIIRFVFASDDYINDEGVAFDSIKIRDCYAGQDNNLFTCVNSSSGLLNLDSLLDENAASDGVWTSNNSLTIQENNQIDLSQITATDLYNFTYTVSGGDGCFDQASIDINAQLIPNAGDNNVATICGGLYQIDLNEYLTSNADFDGIWTALDELQIDDIHIITASAIQTSGTFRFEYTVSSANCGTSSAIVTLTIEKALSPGENAAYDCSTLLSTDELFTALGGNPDPGGRWEPNEGDASFGNTGTYRYIHDATENCPESFSEIIFTANFPDAGFDREYFVQIENDNGNLNLDDFLAEFGKNAANSKKPISKRWIFSSGPREAPVDDTGNVDFPNTGAGPEQAYVFVYTLENDCGEEDSAIITIYISGWNPTNEESTIAICEGETLTAQDLFDSLTKEGLRDFDNVWLDANNSEVSFPVGAGTYFYEDFGSNTANVTVTIDNPAGEDNTVSICANENIILYSYLSANSLLGGIWTSNDGLTIMNQGVIFQPQILIDNINNGVYTFTYTVSSATCESDSSLLTLDITKPVSPGENGTYDCSTLLSTDELFTALGGNPNPGGRWEPNEGDATFGNAGTYRYIHDATENCPESSSEVIFTATFPDAGFDREYFVQIENDNGNLNLDDFLAEFGKNSANSKKPISSRWTFSTGPRPAPVDDIGNVDFPNTGAGPDQAYVFVYALENDCGEEDSAIITINISGWNPTNEQSTIAICEGESLTAQDLFDSLTKEGLRDFDNVWLDANNTEVSFPVGAGTYFYEDFNSNTANVTVTILPSEPAAFNGESFSYDANCLGVTKTDFFNIMGITDENEKIGVFYYCEKESGFCNYEEEADFTNPVGDGKYSYALINAGNCISNSTAEITVSGYPIADAGEEPLEPILIDYNEFIDPEGISDLDEVLSFWRDSNSNKFNSKKLVVQSSWSFKSGQRTLIVTDDGGVDFPNTGAGLPWLYEFEYTVMEDACGGSSDTIIVAVDVQGFEMNQQAGLTICSGTTITDALLESALSPDLNWNDPGVWTQDSENPNIYNGIDLLDNTAEVTITEITPDPPDAGPDRAYYITWGLYDLDQIIAEANSNKSIKTSKLVSRRWTFTSTNGPLPATIEDDSDVDFPNTGSGGEVEFTFIYTVENDCGETDEAEITFYLNDGNLWSLNMKICEGGTLTNENLFAYIYEFFDGKITNYNGNWEDIINGGFLSFPVGEGFYRYTDITSNWYELTVTEQACSKIFLQGAYNTSTGLMNDNLRINGLITQQSPYSDQLNVEASVLETSGNNAIVDWIWLELRDGSNSQTVISQKSALLQRDGHILNKDGVTPLNFGNTSGDYYLVVSHRNHLGIITANTINIFVGALPIIDLTIDNTLINGGSNAIKTMSDNKLALFAGDFNGDGQVQNTDKNAIEPLRGVSGYNNADIDMNGEVQNTDINSLLNPNIGKGQQYTGKKLHAKRKFTN